MFVLKPFGIQKPLLIIAQKTIKAKTSACVKSAEISKLKGLCPIWVMSNFDFFNPGR